MTMIPKGIFEEIGGFDEDYFIWSEEWDLSMRVRQAGYRLMVEPRARICHKVGHSLGVMQPLNYYYGIRNGLLFKRKFLAGHVFGLYLAFYLFNRMVRFSQLAAMGRRDLASAGLDAVLDFFRGKTGKWPRQP
jgi:GT2 family glycosyltransferase